MTSNTANTKSTCSATKLQLQPNYCDMQTFSSTFLSSGTKKTSKENGSNLWATEDLEDWCIHNKHLRSWEKLQLGFTSKYPFQFSFVSLFYPSPPMLHKANLLSDGSSTSVCWGRRDWEGFSNENKEGKNDGGSKEKESDRLLRLRSFTDPPVCVAAVVVIVGADFDGSQVAAGMDLISQTTALWEGRKRERVCVF